MGYLQILLTGGSFFLCYRLAKRYKFSHTDSLFLALAFCFGSVYVTVAFIPWSWYFAQAIVTFCLLLSLYEWHGRKRYILIGLLFALIVATRATAAPGLLFFVGDLFWKNKESLKTKLKHLRLLLLPVILAAALVMSYNYARFGNVLESGYQMADNKRSSDINRYELTHYGLFQFRNIPTNIYYYFIKTVDPVRVEHYGDFGQTYLLKPPYVRVENPGAGFFIISPVFLYLFALIKRKHIPRVVFLSLPPVTIITIILMTFFWPGWAQLGPRYMLDALPFMYLMLLCAFEKSKVTLFAKLVIVVSVIFNFYLLVT